MPPGICGGDGMCAAFLLSATNQTLCPIGHHCPTRGMCEPLPCPLGSFVSCAGKERCDPCPLGRFCPTVIELILCPTGSSACKCGVKCPAGAWEQDGVCPRGSYCPQGAAEAALCDAGCYCPDEGMCAPLLCPEGTTSPAGAKRADQCTKRRRLLDLLGVRAPAVPH
jgi:hypothetical protein